MRWMTWMFLLAFTAGCAGPSGRGDDRDALRRAEAKRELERECRIAAMERRYDPDCPQAQPDYGAPGPQRAPLPAPPDVRLPGG